jgi:hypothetical protein
MARGAILWVIWKEINKLIFQGAIVNVSEHWEEI